MSRLRGGRSGRSGHRELSDAATSGDIAASGAGAGPAPVAMTPTRRQALVGAAIALGSFACTSAAPAMRAGRSDDEIPRDEESIHQVTRFAAGRDRVYRALTDTAQFHQVTVLSGALKAASGLGSQPTEISGDVGGTFTLFGGHIIGRQLELVPGERIVQAWRVTTWDPGCWSIARFELQPDSSGTRLVFDHTGFPRGLGEHLAAGWREHYWEPLAQLLT